MSIRVLVADDSVIYRRVISEALSGIAGVVIAGYANNGRQALVQCQTLHPDVLTLDIEMPELNGLEVLQHLRSAGDRTSVIVLSGQGTRAAELTVRALQLGALDFLRKPDGGTAVENLTSLRRRLEVLLRAPTRTAAPPSARTEPRLPANTSSACGPLASPSCGPQAGRSTPLTPIAPTTIVKPAGPPPRLTAGPPLVLVGVSTGGPAALAHLIPALPPTLRAPVLIVQHMPPNFTAALAESLAMRSRLPVREAIDSEPVLPGQVLMAPGGRQMKLARSLLGEPIVRITDDAPEQNCRPAVDYLFRSAALEFPGRSIAVVLTGMGSDGTVGLRLLRRSGCVALAQDEATCTVFGMPRAAIEAGAVDLILPLDRIPDAIVRAVAEAPK